VEILLYCISLFSTAACDHVMSSILAGIAAITYAAEGSCRCAAGFGSMIACRGIGSVTLAARRRR
jgi:hypothetical protein